ncbi:MAG TPA: TolC family protein [Candidatus Hydrogenedentes bacterium]|nr:TolC family protein [Candidatus Hydrogenedentota bacterium]HPG68045.1 TolC family protein [Candidatus Hydrogenedentota bacterium]
MLGILMAAAIGCSTTHYKEAADREVYGIIAEEGRQVVGMPETFSIEEAEVSLDGLPTVPEAMLKDIEFLGETAQDEIGCPILSLEQALSIAVRNSREYQSQKESLYVRILSYTETRQRYTPVFSGRAQGTYTAETRDVTKRSGTAVVAEAAPDVIRNLDGLAGTPTALLNSYAAIVESAATATGANAAEVAIEQDRSVAGTTSLGVDMLMKGGAAIAIGITSNFLRFVKGDPQAATSSMLNIALDQPLLGSERRAATEALTQAERDVLYALRAFTRYRKQFSVNIASTYYRVLQDRDAVRNNWFGYTAFKKDLERAQAEANEGRITKADFGRTKEGELQSRNQWVTAIQEYHDALDAFKIELGLPTDARVVLDEQELTTLIERGPAPAPDFTPEDAIQVALSARLDYQTERDRMEDSARQLQLATDGLLPNLGVSAGARVDSTGRDNFQELDLKRYTWDAGLDLDPKLNRKSVRNKYRQALIALAASQRDFEEYEDEVKLGVRRAWRQLEQAAVSYEIQMNSLHESERRVLHQELLIEAGQGKTLDWIDAQNDLNRARNSVSSALVSHTIAYLKLWLEMGILYIKENGQWEDVTDADHS